MKKAGAGALVCNFIPGVGVGMGGGKGRWIFGAYQLSSQTDELRVCDTLFLKRYGDVWYKTQVDVWLSHPGVRTPCMKSHAHVHTPHPNTHHTHLHRCDIKFIVLLNLSLVSVWAQKSSWIKKKSVDTSYFLREHPALIAQRNEWQLSPFIVAEIQRHRDEWPARRSGAHPPEFQCEL